MILAVNSTRMELLKLARRISIAKRGHKLLKDKQDELMRKFLAIIERAKALRYEVENVLRNIFKNFIKARMINPGEFIDKQLISQKQPLVIEEKKERFLNLIILHYGIKEIPKHPVYSFFSTTSDLDIALSDFRNILPKMIELAEIELKIKFISEEIKKTRRRVNALEYILIPSLIDTVKYINMKIAELERSNLTRLMRVKEAL